MVVFAIQQNKTKQNAADLGGRSGKDYGGIRAAFCFVLFWGKTLRLKQIKNGRNGRILATLGGLGYFGWPRRSGYNGQA